MARKAKAASVAVQETTGEQAYQQAASASPTSRWFRVTADRFDWLFAPLKMKSFKKGQVCYEPMACVTAGLAAGAIEVIEKPEGAKVGKDGKVILAG